MPMYAFELALASNNEGPGLRSSGGLVCAYGWAKLASNALEGAVRQGGADSSI